MGCCEAWLWGWWWFFGGVWGVAGILGAVARLWRRGPLAQSVELRTFNPSVVGSSPTGPTMSYQKITCQLGKKA